MIAFALRETGSDPAWLIGAPVPQLGSNAGAGEGWLVVEGDESDRTVFGLPAEIAVITNVELDHHSEFRVVRRARGGVRPLGCAATQVVRDAPPFEGELALPGEHNRRNAGAALAALELAGVARPAAAGARRASSEPGGASRSHEADGVTIVDDYAHHPTELAATIAAAREAFRDEAACALPAAPRTHGRGTSPRARCRARGRRRHRRHRHLSGPRGNPTRRLRASSSSIRCPIAGASLRGCRARAAASSTWPAARSRRCRCSSRRGRHRPGPGSAPRPARGER